MILLKKDLTIDEFTTNTTSFTREKVFSKWIKQNMEKNLEYLSIKKKTSTIAASNLVKHVKRNLDHEYKGLKRLLQVYESEYYYAKSTPNRVKIYKVPSEKDFEKVFLVKSISFSVPESQINIHTEIINKTSGQSLILRNEVRFSHGQFNGTPEAKMYYGRGSNLETIYENLF
jgi:hypothetical protein